LILSLKDERQRFVMVEKTNIPGHLLLVRYLHDSHQGSCTLETDESGNVITYEEYHPFGTSSYQATNAGILSSSKRYRYVGKERDEESGLYYYGARFYAPWLCRFMSCDPKAAQFPDQSPYNYCFNNPINLIDPDGMEPEGMGDEVVNNTSNIGFPENPKDGDEYIHYNQEQNANWGYVYNAASQSWLGTGTAANLPTVEVISSATPRAAFTGGPMMGQPESELHNPLPNPSGPINNTFVNNLLAQNTSLKNLVKPGQHLSFEGIITSGGAGVGLLGSDATTEVITIHKSDKNIHTYKNNYTVQYAVVNMNSFSGYGTSANVSYLYGDMFNIDPYEDPTNRFENSNDMLISGTVGIFSAGYNAGDMNKGGFSYNTFGIGVGAEFKTNIKPTSANVPAGIATGIVRMRLSGQHIPSINDSINFAKIHPNLRRSQEILNRYGVR
jgi:RHS repeat-associated protein